MRNEVNDRNDSNGVNIGNDCRNHESPTAECQSRKRRITGVGTGSSSVSSWRLV